jgi:hypothetical protein
MNKITQDMHNNKYDNSLQYMRNLSLPSSLTNEEHKLRSIDAKLAFEKGFDCALQCISELLASIKGLDDYITKFKEDAKKEDTEES